MCGVELAALHPCLQLRHSLHERNQSIVVDLHVFDRIQRGHTLREPLADLHDADGTKDANGDTISVSMVHADITTDQFIIIDGKWKLNDFNRCRFMRRQRKTGPETGDGDGKPCGFQVGNNPGKGRSPEEYNYQEETEKVDIYSLGNVFYTMRYHLMMLVVTKL